MRGKRIHQLEIPESPALAEVMQAAHALSRQNGVWRKPQAAVQKQLLKTIGKLTQAHEELLYAGNPARLRYNKERPEGFGVALVDALLLICDIAGQYRIDLEGLAREVHRLNIQGSVRKIHGRGENRAGTAA